MEPHLCDITNYLKTASTSNENPSIFLETTLLKLKKAIAQTLTKTSEISALLNAKKKRFGKNQKPYWNNHLTLLKKLKLQLWHKYKTTGCKETNAEFHRVKREFRSALRTAEKSYSNRKKLILNQLFFEDRLEFWKKCNLLKGLGPKPAIPFDQLTEHFNDYFSKKTKDSDDLVAQINKYANEAKSNQEEITISPVVIEEIIKSFKNKKSPGIDNISVKFLKKCSPNLSKLLALLLEVILKTNTVPRTLLIGNISPIIKDPSSDLTSVNNIRPITINSAIYNIFDKYLLRTVLDRNIDDKHHQYGFKTNAGCPNAIYSLRETILNYKSKGKKLYCLTIDLSKAFDRFNRNKLLVKLKDKIHPKWWLYIYNCYKFSSNCIKQNNKISAIKSEIGTRQGAPSSPKFFSFFIDELIDLLVNSGRLANIVGYPVGLMLYADDIILLCEGKEDLESCIRIIESFFKERELTINETKCDFIIFSPKYISEKITINNVELTSAEQIKYLGVYISHNLSNEFYLQDRRNKANAAVLLTHRFGSNLRDLSLDVKVQLYKTYVRPVLMYGVEVMNLTNHDYNSLVTNEHVIIKRFFNFYERSHKTKFIAATEIKPTELYYNEIQYRFFLRSPMDYINNLITEHTINQINNYTAKALATKNFSTRSLVWNIYNNLNLSISNFTSIISTWQTHIQRITETMENLQLNETVQNIRQCLKYPCKSNRAFIKHKTYVKFGSKSQAPYNPYSKTKRRS